MAAPGSEHPATFRMLHVFEFDTDAIQRDNVWMDVGAILTQLTPVPVP